MTKMESLVREMEILIRKAERCPNARDVLGGNLHEARMIVDSMQYLCDCEYFQATGKPGTSALKTDNDRGD
jgi:hypothetical protein